MLSGLPGRSPGATHGRGPVRPGTPIESPRGGRERAEAINFTAKLPPESKISSSFRASRSKSCGAAICRRILSFFGVCANRANPSEVPHLSAKTEVRPIALHIESLARSDLEKRRKSHRKLMQNRAEVAFAVAWATFSVDFCRAKPAKSMKAIRFGPIEPARAPRSVAKLVEHTRTSPQDDPGRSSSQAPSANFLIDI